MSVDDGLRELIPFLKRYRGASNIIFGEPHVLKRLCKCFGFKNDCPRGRIYLTDAKAARLEALGLTPSDEPLPPGFSDAPSSLEEAHGEALEDRGAFFQPPPGTYVDASQMPPAARAYAFYLHMQAGWFPVDTGRWSYCAERDAVVVTVQDGRGGVTFAVGRTRELDETLAAIEMRWGAEVRARAEEAVRC
jgi:hypothetical protein